MVTEIIFTIVAEDRSGLVEIVSEVVTRHSGNWVDSSMAHLGGEFAGIVCVEVPDINASQFEKDLAALVSQEIEIHVRKGKKQELAPAGSRASIELTGADHSGIVHEVSRVLAQLGTNIEMLQTEVYSASMSGDQMFKANIKILLPVNLEIEDVSDALEAIANDIMVDIVVSDHP